MKNVFFPLVPIVSILMLWNTSAFAVEVAPRISDRDIVESLAEVRGDIKRLGERLDAVDKGLNKRIDDLHTDLRAEMNGKFDDLRSEMNGKFDGLHAEMNGKFDGLRSEMNSRFEGVNHRFEEVNHRFDTLQWTLGLFITIALVILAFVLRMQWQMHRRQTRMETVLETQRDELSFIKKLIEKFMPPRGVL